MSWSSTLWHLVATHHLIFLLFCMDEYLERAVYSFLLELCVPLDSVIYWSSPMSEMIYLLTTALSLDLHPLIEKEVALPADQGAWGPGKATQPWSFSRFLLLHPSGDWSCFRYVIRLGPLWRMKRQFSKWHVFIRLPLRNRTRRVHAHIWKGRRSWPMSLRRLTCPQICSVSQGFDALVSGWKLAGSGLKNSGCFSLKNGEIPSQGCWEAGVSFDLWNVELWDNSDLQLFGWVPLT